MADFASAGSDETAGFTDRERREVVVEDEALRGGAAGEAVHVLGLLGRPEGDDGDVLGVTSLEHGGTMNAGQYADLRTQWAERFRIAFVGADAACENCGAVGFVLQVFKHDVQVDVGEFVGTEFGGKSGLRLFLERFDVGGADVFLVAENGGGNTFGRDDTLNDSAGFGRGTDELEGGLRLAGEANEFADRDNDGLDSLVAEGEGLDEFLLGNLVGRTFDHQHVLLVADIDEVERGGIHLLDGRIGDELVVDQGDAHAADRSVPWNVGDGEGGAGAVDHRNVGIVDQIGRKELADDLHLIEETLGEERTAGTVAEAGDQNLALGRTAFAFEIAAGETAGGGIFVAVVDRERKEILAGTHGLRGAGGDDDIGFANVDVDGAAGELGDGARGEREPETGHGNIMFLIHGI